MLYKLTKQPPLPPHFRPTATAGTRTTPSSLDSLHVKESDDGEEEDDESSDAETYYEEETDLRDGNLLMIDQLWLWAIDTSKRLKG